MYSKKGFSLLELLMTITLIAIISAAMFPNFKNFFQQSQEKIVSTRLLHALQLARSEAILRGITVTICKSNDHAACSGNWDEGQIIFADPENTAVISNKENLLYVFNMEKHDGTLHWRSSLHRDYLSFYPSGNTHGEDGTFWYCRKGSQRASWAVVVNQAGRSRYVPESNVTDAYVC